MYADVLSPAVGTQQVMLELHGRGHDAWFQFYRAAMLTGFSLVSQTPTRYSGSGKNRGRKRDRIWRHSDSRASNFTKGCDVLVGEFGFYRAAERRAAGASKWDYTSIAYQLAEE